MKMKAMCGVVATTALTIGMLAGGAVAASATYTEGCTPKAAWTETVVDKAEIPAVLAIPEIPEKSHTAYQRYSWVGGPITEAPAATPPGPDWQANTENYEGAGHGDDPIGSPFPKNENGKADWFFWTATKVIDQAYVAGVPGKDAVPAETHTVEHAAVACDAPPITEWHTWETELADGVTTPTTANDVTWPQDYVGPGQLTPPCGIWYQQDRYVGTADEIDDVIEDGVLDGLPPEDSGIVAEWHFVYGGDCPPPGDDLIPVPALFAAQPSAPDCNTDGILPTFDGSQFPNVTFQINPEFTGPGEYVLTVTPNEGYAFDPDNLPAGWGYEPDGGAVSRVLTVNGATGVFQSTEPEAACYRAPTDVPPVDEPPVDNPPVDTPVDNPPVVTPAVVVVTHTTTVPAASTTKTLAVTGGEETPWLPIGGLALVLSGIGTLIWRRVRA